MRRTVALLFVPLAVAAAVPYIASAQTNPQLTPAQARGRIAHYLPLGPRPPAYS